MNFAYSMIPSQLMLRIVTIVELQLELIDLKYHEPLKSAFSTGDIIDFYLLTHAFYIGSMLGATFVNKQSFSLMKAVKTSHRSRLTNEHLDSVVRLALSVISRNIVDLVGSKMCQKSSKNHADSYMLG